MPRRFFLQTAYAPIGVVFDGTNDALTRSSAYSGVVDGTQVTFAFWVRLQGAAADQHIVSKSGLNTANPGFVIGRTASNEIYVSAFDTSASLVFVLSNYRTITPLTVNTAYAVLGSFDLNSITSRHLYLDDVSVLSSPSPYSAVNMKLSGSLQAVGTKWDGTSGFRFNGELADLWVDWGRYTDFSITANRRLFFDASNALVDKGASGQIPFGTAPDLFLGGSGATAATWHNNLGTGGPLTLVGSLGTSSPPPAGA